MLDGRGFRDLQTSRGGVEADALDDTLEHRSVGPSVLPVIRSFT
jgi:hypothetical protein